MIGLIDLGRRPHRELGRAHGEAWGDAARELFLVRWDLTRQRCRIKDEARLVTLALAHLPVLRGFDEGLADELVGVADAAGLAPWQLVILNNYTDFRDLPPDAGGCSTVHLPMASGRVVGQTWDMHGTAEPFVRALRLATPAGPSMALFTITGCLGMAGLNEHGVAVCINNLSPDDAQVGVLWPALVRRMLTERTAAGALAVLRAAPLASGHNYLIADPGAVFNVETTGRLQRLTHDDPARPYFHTNHYTHPDLLPRELPPHPASTTRDRWDRLAAASAPASLEEAWALLGSHDGHPRSICSHMKGDDPSAARTCGALLCDLVGRRMLVAQGCVHDAPHLEVSAR